jgi:hypothetical protein
MYKTGDKMEILNKIAIFLLIFFLVAFPKGGFKIGDIPITWGYLYIMLIGIIGFYKLFKLKFLPKINLYLLLFMLPFQVIICVTFLLYGYTTSIGFFLSIILNFVIFPFVFLILFHTYEKINLFFLFKILKWSVFFTAVYGIVLFVYMLFTGEIFEIPYLSVNMDDDNILTKHIYRGEGFFKLISTYNNGNIYGEAILILLPLYYFLETNNFRRLLVKIALILTLSRTVWIGIILFEFMNIFRQKKFQTKPIVYFIISICCIFGGVWWFISSAGLDINFLFDENLGGRRDVFEVFSDIHLLPNEPINSIHGIAYISILGNYGLFGLLAFAVGLFSPTLFYFLKIVPNAKSEYKKSIVMGIFIYLFIACNDHAILYIPVTCFYWFCVFLLIRKQDITYNDL